MIDRRTFLLAPLALAGAAERPANLLLMVPSGWRGQAVPWDNDPDLRAPNLEKFGKQSVVFSRTYCACPKPDLARTALLTSKFPHAAKVDDAVLGQLKRMSPDAAIAAFHKPPFAIEIEFPIPPNLRQPDQRSLHLRKNVPAAKDAVVRRELAGFYGLCSAIDAEIGRVLAALDRLNLAVDTVVAFTSDCGQQIGSHGLDGNDAFFEESVRIPLAIRYPRKLKPDALDLASQVDILPTLLALAGMEIPDGVQGEDLFGKPPRETAFAEGQVGFEGEWRMLLVGYNKLIATPKAQATHLYNLAADRFELTDLAGMPGQRLTLASLVARLKLEMQQLGDGMDPSGLRIR